MKPEMGFNPQKHPKTPLERQRRKNWQEDPPTMRQRKRKDRNEEKIPNLASELLIADTSVLHQSPRLAVLKNLPTASDFQELPPTVMITGSRTFSYREEG
ncbi:hypothetical protein Bca4012_099129 [Brassica carinata]